MAQHVQGQSSAVAFWVVGRPLFGLRTLVEMKLSAFKLSRGLNLVQLLPKEPACQWLVSRAGKAAALPCSLDRHQGAGGI